MTGPKRTPRDLQSAGAELVQATAAYVQAVEDAFVTQPPPTEPPVEGQGVPLGLYQLGDSLEQQTHLTDSTYTGPIIADWHDGNWPQARDRGYIYTQAPQGTPGGNIDLGNPQAFLDTYLPIIESHGGIGLFLDNVQPSCGPQLVSFLEYVYPRVRDAGYLFGGNVSISDSPLTDASDDGRGWVKNVQLYAPYLDLLMLEGWQQCLYGPEADGIPCLRLRGNDYMQHWDEWQQAIGAAKEHTRGKCVFLISYAMSSGDFDTAVYGRASALEAGLDPGDCFAFMNMPHTDSYDPYWTKTNPEPVVDPVNGTASL
jgi:hypothetical protein